MTVSAFTSKNPPVLSADEIVTIITVTPRHEQHQIVELLLSHPEHAEKYQKIKARPHCDGDGRISFIGPFGLRSDFLKAMVGGKDLLKEGQPQTS
jgi:hypothetical protein